jgi:small GTP-binding protein
VTRSGFVALAGRPNVGKSTFVNAVVGEKVAIVSDRPQTTRRAIRGVYGDRDCQMVLVDLPGVQRPRDALTARMARRVQQELEGSDAALLTVSRRPPCSTFCNRRPTFKRPPRSTPSLRARVRGCPRSSSTSRR